MSEDRIVVVGVDGSAGSAVAVRWALDHADQLGAIEPVMAFVVGPLERRLVEPDVAGGANGPIEPYRADAVERLQDFLQANAPALAGAAVVVESRPGPGLVKAAMSAELLVVGTRGWSGRLDLSVGSVGAYCVRHSTVPVALIPRDLPPVHDHLDVVVGVDGSPHSENALRWTLTHLRRNARVDVVRVFTDDTVAGEVLGPSPHAAEATARDELEQEVAVVLASLPERHPSVDLQVAPGDPRAVLRAIGGDADLLVVGARGRGGLDHLLLGSVASALAHHPGVPTVIVPNDLA